MAPSSKITVHPSAEVSPESQIGEGTQIWQQVQVREGARIGENCILGKGVYVDTRVVIGSNVKIQNGASIFSGSILEDGVFIGPHACLTNDKLPRAITPNGLIKGTVDWEIGTILVRYGASVGAGAVVLPNVTIGEFALVGAGAVVTADVPDHGMVVGIPARLKGFVCKCAGPLEIVPGDCSEIIESSQPGFVRMSCRVCGDGYDIRRDQLAWVD